MTLVAGVDSSTQGCKVVICDARTGVVVRHGYAPHPPGTSVDPACWLDALRAAIDDAGGTADVTAISVAGQQHGMICLDEQGQVVRDVLMWNDTRSGRAAEDLVGELPGGAAGWASAVGSVPVAAFTVAKLRWLADHEPENAGRTAAVCLPHDWLTWRLRDGSDITTITTDRGDASGTGYWSPAEASYRPDLVDLAFGRLPELPEVLGPFGVAGQTPTGTLLGVGTGDNAAGALGVGAGPGDLVVSVGTSGVVAAVSGRPTADASGQIAGFADAAGAFLPLACTLNAARVLEAAARMLGVGLDKLSDLALSSRPGADGLVFVPYLEGERTPNRPEATGALHGMTGANTTPANLARAAVEGLLCGLADGLDALRAVGVEVSRAVLIGGAARSAALCRIAPTVLGLPVDVPEPAEHVAAGAARQAAWAVATAQGVDAGPDSTRDLVLTRNESDPVEQIRERYAQVRDLTGRR